MVVAAFLPDGGILPNPAGRITPNRVCGGVCRRGDAGRAARGGAKVRRVGTHALPDGSAEPRLLDRRRERARLSDAGVCEATQLHLAYSFRADVALRRLARRPGITESPIFEIPNVSLPTSFNDAPIA